MSKIIINSENYLEKNLLIRNGYIASYQHLRRNQNLETTFCGGPIFTGNWIKGSWYWEGIQQSIQKFDTKMLELRNPIMDEKWFAIILMHITNWEHKSNNYNTNKSLHYLRIDLKSLLQFLKEQRWEIKDLSSENIISVTEEYVCINENLIKLFFKEIASQEKFLREYAHKEFINNNKSDEYLWIHGEITKDILDVLENPKKIKLNEDNICVYFDKNDEQVLFEFEFKCYIENYVTNINNKTYYILTEKLTNDLERFLELNKNNKLTQEELDELIEQMPLMIELKKESKILARKDKISLMKTQTDLLKNWSLPNSFNEFRNYLLEAAINKIIKSKVTYSMKEKENNLFKIGKNDIGLNVFIDGAEKLKHIASDDIEFAKNFRNHFNVLSINEYDYKYESYDKRKNYIFFEVNSYKNLNEERKNEIIKILNQGRSCRNFIWFNLPKEEIEELFNTVYIWNIMSLYIDKNLKKENLKNLHPQLHKVIKNIFISQLGNDSINEFII